MVRSHTQELLSLPRLRTACDRCHSQKLRCLKPPEGDACLRCTKFGSSCVYSARTSRRTKAHGSAYALPNAQATTTMSSRVERSVAESAMLDVAFGAESGLDLSLCAQMPFDPIHCGPFDVGTLISSPFNSCQQPNMNGGDVSSQNSLKTDSLSDLADLNSKLVDHHASLLSVLLAPSPSLGSKVIALDQTFALTRRFIDVLKQYNARSTDQATALLFLSCYYRLVELYESLFEKMQVCTQNPQAIITGTKLRLPAIQVGSYVPNDFWKTLEPVNAPMTAYSMQFMLLLLLCTRLCEELRDAIASGFTRTPGRETSWESQRAELVQESLHCSVRTLNLGGDKDQFGESVKNAMWARWVKLSEQIETTKKAAMVFAVACL